MSRRSLFIHAGLHKTGTTALQNALAPNPSWIAAHGYRFPLAGRPEQSGHHNIAWEITEDRRFRAHYGSASDLIAEIRDGDDNIILSSEDFTGALAYIDRFQDFVNSFRGIFPDICVVLFLRNQADYALSLYLELLGHGFDMTFSSFLSEIAANGALRWREWRFPFDFQEFLSSAAEVEGVRLKICSYDLRKSALAETLLSACELPGEVVEPISLAQLNSKRPGGWYVARFLGNRRGWPANDAQSVLLDRIQQSWMNKSISLSAEARRFISNRFRASNDYVSTRYGVPLNRFMEVAALASEASQPGAIGMSSPFSTEFEEFFEDVEILAAEYKAIETERNHLRTELDKMAATLREMAKDCESLREHVDAACAERDSLAAELIAVSAARDALALERDAILHSRSWRLTEPLRRARLLSGFRKTTAESRKPLV